MFGSLDLTSFPRIVRYSDAKRHEERIKPIRGSTLKPYGARTKKWLNIRQEGGDVVVRMHSTDIIKYKPDDTIIVNFGGWGTSSTMKVVGHILGVSIGQRHRKVWCYSEGVEHPIPVNKNLKFIVPSGSTVAVYVPEGNPVRYVLDRKLYHKFKKDHYAQFIKYVEGMRRLRNGRVFTSDDLKAVLGHGSHHTIRDWEVDAWMRDQDSWGNAAAYILYMSSPPVYSWMSEHQRPTIDATYLTKSIKHVILSVHAEEAKLVKAEEYTGGGIFRDEYSQYMP